MVALAVAGRAGWRASDLELRDDVAVVHVGDAAAVSRARLRAVRAVLRDRRRCVRRDRDAGGTTRRFSTARTSPSSRGPGIRVERHARTGCRRSRTRMVRAAARRHQRTSTRSIILIDAPTADVSSTAIRDRRARRRIDRRAGARSRCGNTLNSTDFTRRTSPGRRGQRRARPTRRQAGCMAKTEQAPQAASASARRSSSRVRAAEDKKADRPRRARSAQGRRVHRLLRDLLGHQPAADSRDCRRA